MTKEIEQSEQRLERSKAGSEKSSLTAGDIRPSSEDSRGIFADKFPKGASTGSGDTPTAQGDQSDKKSLSRDNQGDGSLALITQDDATRYDRRTGTYYNDDKPVYQKTDTGFKRWDSDGNPQAEGRYDPRTRTYTTEYQDCTTRYRVVETPKGAQVYERGPASDSWTPVTDSRDRQEAVETARKLRKPPDVQASS